MNQHYRKGGKGGDDGMDFTPGYRPIVKTKHMNSTMKAGGSRDHDYESDRRSIPASSAGEPKAIPRGPVGATGQVRPSTTNRRLGDHGPE